MSLPGFTAEASLYQTSACYHMVGSLNTVIGSRGVVPQQDQSQPVPYCSYLCNGSDDQICMDWCVNTALGGLFGGDGFGMTKPWRCRPQCSPCQPEPDLGSGLWRACLNPSCEITDLRCFQFNPGSFSALSA